MIAFGIASIIATSQGLGVWGLVIGQYAYAITDFVALLGDGPLATRGCGQVSFGMWRELVGYGRHVLAGSAIRRFGDRVPILVAGGMLEPSAVGQLQYANRIVTTPYSLLIAGISYVVFPAFARIAGDRDALHARLPAIAAVVRARRDADRPDPGAARRAAGDHRLRRALERSPARSRRRSACSSPRRRSPR